jgi:sodium-coupled neutral amino acid transporter 11
MADLAKTSRINVTFDFIMVLLVLYCAPIRESWATFDWTKSIVHRETIFVGLGVLSFAFVCQHSAFIIAGSLENPTKSRWAKCTRAALMFACTLALCCGVGGFVGFQEDTKGNILNSLDQDSLPANIARGLLGTTMLFVYPMVRLAFLVLTRIGHMVISQHYSHQMATTGKFCSPARLRGPFLSRTKCA